MESHEQCSKVKSVGRRLRMESDDVLLQRGSQEYKTPMIELSMIFSTVCVRLFCRNEKNVSVMVLERWQ